MSRKNTDHCVEINYRKAISSQQCLLDRPDHQELAQHQVPPPSINGSIQCHACLPEQRAGKEKKMMCKRLQFMCQWRQRGCQSPRSPQMLKIGALNEGLSFEEAILTERLAACFLKWLCWHEEL